MLIHYIFVGLGGAGGAITRVFVSKLLPMTVFGVPIPIMTINILGCFIIGVLTELMALSWNVSENIRYLLVPGFLGGFTTFSSFALEFGLLVEKNQNTQALLYATCSVFLSLLMFFLGLKLIRIII